jgi:fibronectin-binding autotransporter adhesin
MGAGLLLAGLILLQSTLLEAANDLFWDTNGTTAGSGAATGIWGTNSFWTTDADGITNTFRISTATNNDLHFYAGTNGTTGTITVNGNQLAGGLYFEESAFTLSGGSITLSDGAFINNSAGSTVIPRISSALVTSGTVTLTGTRFWLDNSSFNGGGTLVVNTSNATLLENGGALNGLSVINVLSGGLDVRTGENGYDYAAGTTLNFINSAGLNTNLSQTVNWKGDITVASTKTATLSAFNGSSTFFIDGDISGAGNITIGGSGVTVFTGTNSYTGTTNISGSALRITGGAAIADTGLVNLGTGSTANSFDVQTSETIGGLGSGTAAFSVVNIEAGRTLTLSAGTQTYSGTFSGTGGLTVAGAAQTLASSISLTDLRVESGSLTLSAANTIANGLVMTGGTVQLRDAASAGLNAIEVSGGTVQGATARGSTLTLPNAITVSAGNPVILSPQASGGSSGTALVNFAGTMRVDPGGVLQLGNPGSNAAYGADNGAVVFGPSALSGTKFQLNGNSFQIAGLSTDGASPGEPAVENGGSSNATLTVALPASGTSSYEGTLRNGGTGSLALTVNGGAGSALILAAENTHTGSTTVTGGTLVLSHRLTLQSSTLVSGGTGLVFDSSVSSHAFTLGGFSGTTDLVLEDNASNAVALSIGNNGTSQNYSGSLSGAGNLTKVGAGIQTFSAAHTYSGATTVNGGTLKILFGAGAPTTDIISSGSALVLGGGIFLQQQSTAGPNAQTVNGVTVRAGSSVINQIRVGGGTMLLTLGSIARETGGTVAFSANGGGTSGIAATGTNTASGIIGGYATYFTTNGGANFTNGIDWATYSGGKIVALSAGAYSNTSATTAATNLNMTTNLTLNPDVAVGSIRFNNAISTPTLTLNGTHTVGSGGILVTGNTGANPTLITSGTLASGNGQDLIVIQNNTNAVLTIDSTITGATGLTKSGGGQLILTGTNDYTGPTFLNGGTTVISDNANLGDVSTGGAVNFNGGTLSVTGTVTLDNAGSNARAVFLGNNGGTLDVATSHILTRISHTRFAVSENWLSGVVGSRLGGSGLC